MVRRTIKELGEYLASRKNNVIYIDPATWYYMRMLRESIREAIKRDPKKFKTMIEVHSKFYRKALREVVVR